MKPIIENIGIPHLSEEELEQLAEDCEDEISKFMFQKIPPKSIEELSVSCSLDLSDTLDLDVQIDLIQSYETGHDLNELIQEATNHGVKWLDQKLSEMKGS
jgi:hypothetical protein